MMDAGCVADGGCRAIAPGSRECFVPDNRVNPRGLVGYRLAYELDGILAGIGADGVIHRLETERLVNWLAANAPFAHVKPFSELADRIERALADGVLTPDECEDLRFVTSKYTVENPYLDTLRLGIRSLMGVVAGITADRHVNEYEMALLNQWLDSWSYLSGLWPYDECNTIVTDALSGALLPTHVEQLEALDEQLPIAGRESGSSPPLLIADVCAVDPRITFLGKTFVFTGESARAEREDMATVVLALGGAEEPDVTRRSDYLVVCDGGSEFWAFSSYGRKVEQAYAQRRQGHQIVIVHERDFWEAVTGHGMSA
jgi:hypothetical protein